MIRVPLALREGELCKLDAGILKSLDLREIKVKEAFTARDSAGVFWRLSLQERGERAGTAVAYERMPRSPESPMGLTLVCPVLGRQRMLVVCQKATELGVSKIIPVISDHSVQRGGLEHEKPWAWKGQCLKAARQCRRSSVPELTEVRELREVLESAHVREAQQRYALDDRTPIAHDPLGELGLVCSDHVVLVVGPEGGFSDNERALLAAQGCTVLALGGRVLRAETAVLVGLTVLQHRLGDLRV
ncbi:MAG: RsmE family RNA methyltransferase [Deltaproteobacteria bacterium]|nr:RsmE family RNA methyltransferase [Deltaproteobacteria bacterium]